LHVYQIGFAVNVCIYFLMSCHVLVDHIYTNYIHTMKENMWITKFKSFVINIRVGVNINDSLCVIKDSHWEDFLMSADDSHLEIFKWCSPTSSTAWRSYQASMWECMVTSHIM
jgi:hypothetical protein